MALHIRALNNDTTFLLTFIPSVCPPDQKFPETFPGAFTILIDPFIPPPRTAASTCGYPLSPPTSSDGINTSNTEETKRGEVTTWSFDDIPEPDIILISQAHDDHCHEETLCSLSPHTQSLIVASPDAAKKIARWRHFDGGTIQSLKRYKARKSEDTLFSMEIPPPSPLGESGELTLALLIPRSGLGSGTGIKNTIGITYREPSSILARSKAIGSVPASRASNTGFSNSSLRPATSYTTTTTASPSFIPPFSPSLHLDSDLLEQTISVLYAPHGTSLSTVQPYIASHLAPASALPPVALFHPTTTVDLPWYAGGNMSSGYPGGCELTRLLLPTMWVAAHDDEDDQAGVLKGRSVVRKKWGLEDGQLSLREGLEQDGVARRVELRRLEVGGTVRVDMLTANEVVEKVKVKVKAQDGHEGEQGDGH